MKAITKRRRINSATMTTSLKRTRGGFQRTHAPRVGYYHAGATY